VRYLRKGYYILLILFFSLSVVDSAFSQDNWWKDKRYKTEALRQKYADCKKVFVNIGDGLNYSNVYEVIPYFGTEVYLNILDDEKGYYSPDQTKFILENFFYQIILFHRLNGGCQAVLKIMHLPQVSINTEKTDTLTAMNYRFR